MGLRCICSFWKIFLVMKITRVYLYKTQTVIKVFVIFIHLENLLLLLDWIPISKVLIINLWLKLKLNIRLLKADLEIKKWICQKRIFPFKSQSKSMTVAHRILNFRSVQGLNGRILQQTTLDSCQLIFQMITIKYNPIVFQWTYLILDKV